MNDDELRLGDRVRHTNEGPGTVILIPATGLCLVSWDDPERGRSLELSTGARLHRLDAEESFQSENMDQLVRAWHVTCEAVEQAISGELEGREWLARRNLMSYLSSRKTGAAEPHSH
jgi:hypothetical protein